MAIALILISFCSSCAHDCIDKGIPSMKFSANIQESKDNKVFQYQLYPTKEKISIDTSSIISIGAAWVESGWGYKCINNKSEMFVNASKYLIIQSSITGNTIPHAYYYLGRHQLGTTKHYFLSDSTNNKYYVYKDTIESNPELTYEIKLRKNHNATPEVLEIFSREKKSKIIDSVQFEKLNSR